MNARQWILSCFIIMSLGCSDELPQPSVKSANNVNTESGMYQQTLTAKNQRKPDYITRTPGFLEQNWDHETRMAWWYTSQGSRLLPYDWFLALERSDSEELVSSEDNLARYRFIAWPADSKWNPDGLPIGFVADKDTASGTRYVGFTCAACHTGKVAYQGKEYLVEGAPAHHDFDRFLTDIANSLQKTTDNSDKFSRFIGRVLGANAKPEDVTALKSMVLAENSKLNQRVKMNHPPHANGYARIDAFGNIFNEVAVVAINEPSNANPANAPVSYPMLWDTPQHNVVQWNGSAVNAGIGAYVRNVGEVAGVFADLHIEKIEGGDPSELRFKNHANINNLKHLEDLLTTLWSPLWPEQMLPVIDQAKAQPGKKIFEMNCISCHHAIKRDDPNRKIIATLIPIKEIGTDPAMATNIITRISKTGLLEKQPVLPLSKLVPNLDKFASQARTVQIVQYGVIGILLDGLDKSTLTEGLPAFLQAAKKNSFKVNCDPKQGGAKCFRPPSYKARPLNGIWASAPFLHNGSVPNLWELLQKPDQRVTTFNVGSWKIDPVKVGFVTGPEPATSEFNSTLPGNSNQGHEYGSELSEKEKWELIEYLKTL